MKKKFKVTLVVFLVVVLGCFSQVFAATNQDNKADKISQVRKNARFLDSATTSPSTQNEEVDQYTKLLMHMDDTTFKDECGHTVTNNGVTLDMTNKKFGNGSAYFNGNSCFKIADNGDFNLSGDFTIDFQFYSTSGNGLIFDCRTSSDYLNKPIFWINNTSSVYFEIPGVISTSIPLPTSFALNTWNHMAIVRHNDIISFYLNGVAASKTYTTSLTLVTGGYFMMGLDRSDPGTGGSEPGFAGNISEFRISKGIARWTSNFTPPTAPYDNVLTTGITLNKTTDSLILNDSIKGTDTLISTVTPDSATNKTVAWTSSDSTIATVDSTGKITAIKAGTATITATTTDGTNLSASCVVTVSEPAETTTISLNKASDLIDIGGNDILAAEVSPSNIGVTWSSSDDSIVTVDADGKITGIKAGTAIITATTADGKTVSCTVTVKDKETGKSKLTLYMNDNTIREFYLTQDEIDNFIDWYTLKIKGEVTVQPYYAFNVYVPGKSSTKKSYVWFMKIESFEVE